MKTEKQEFWKRGRQLMLATAVAFAGGCLGLTSCQEYDLDETTPDGWGESIYSWLEDNGNYSNTVRLIDDLGYRDVLNKTGSKSLFVADDAAYARFFGNNSWGVRSYEQLSNSQKKMLLFGSMIDNSIQLNSLPSVQGTPPREGESMRRYSSSTPYDSVAVLTKEKMPDNAYWKRYRDSGKPMVCMTDNSQVPLIYFIEKQLVNKHITNADYDFLNNKMTHRQTGDASVNGVPVVKSNIKCSNGFIHQTAEVITPLPNMAEIIASKSNVSQWNHLLERYCAPYPVSQEVTTQYNYMYNTHVDTVFEKRFLSKKSQNGLELDVTPDNQSVQGKLKFDPEWNDYYAGSNDQGGNIAMQRDMGVMMVPSNTALQEYWENGAGRALKDNYHTWDSVPSKVLAELINVNMLSSFISSVPSKFTSILNDANDPLGVKVEAIDSVWLGCNGAVYLTNRVYSPTSYVSVLFPALVNETMQILYWGVDQLNYNVYLNSLNSTYSFFIPTNNGMLHYIDPLSYGKKNLQALAFHYDPTKLNERERVWATIYGNYDPTTGTGDSIGVEKNSDVILNRLKDILETHIVIGNVEDGYALHRAKNGTELRVENVSLGKNGMKVAGSYQVNDGQPINIFDVYDQTKDGNGKAYILDGEPIMGTRQTVHDQLAAHPEFSEFLKLLDGSGLTEVVRNKRYVCGGTNLTVFNTFHYTVYVPTNKSITDLQDAGKLPTWDDVANWEMKGNLTKKTEDSLKIENFLRYHIQDNALYIGAAPEDGNYETAYSYQVFPTDPDTWAFHRVNAVLTDTGITLTDKAGNVRHVVTDNPALYNLQAREYMFDKKDLNSSTKIETSSSAVVHLIDGPLLIEN